MSKAICEWCEALGKSHEDFREGDIVTWDMVQHTYWGDGNLHYKKAAYCPMCGRPLSNRLETALCVDDAESIFRFAENGMKLSETAQSMFVHRNTLIYRLDRIRRTTGLNPYLFYDLCQLQAMARYILGKEGAVER